MSLLSQRPGEQPAEAEVAGSDSDSGMGSPMDEAAVAESTGINERQDSDDDIVVNRKARCRKVLQDSDSEGEPEQPGLTEALVLSESSSEEVDKTREKESKKDAARGKRMSRIAMDSEESEPEEKQREERKRREKSQRRREKENHRKRLKEKSAFSEGRYCSVPMVLNDSGCLLGDSDLFDAQLEDDTAGPEEPVEEESLDAIRASLKQKVKNHKSHLYEQEEGDEQEDRPQRTERKAARASREALKNLHSESQRLVRECTMGLPYHMPEPKTIDQFFKRRARPEGPAMALLKSTKYQACILEATAAPSANQIQAKAAQQLPEHSSNTPTNSAHGTAPESSAQAHSLSNSPSAPSEHQENPKNDGEPQTSLDSVEKQPETEASATVQDTVAMDVECAGPAVKESEEAGLSNQIQEGLEEAGQQSEAAAGVSSQAGPAPAGPDSLPVPGPVEPKQKKDKLARLRELGLHPPPVPKLCADDGAFVQLEPARANPALEALKERFLRHVQPVARVKGERTLQLSVVRKDTAPSGQEELRAESVTVTVTEGEEEPTHTKPGEKLTLLKSRLQQAMAVRRQEERERRAALYRLDNEDCDEEEEEEEEMTESEGEEGVDELLGDGEDGDGGEDDAGEEDEAGSSVTLQTRSPAQKGPSSLPDSDGTLMLFAGSSCSRTGDGMRKSGPTCPESDAKMEEEDALSLTKDNSHNSSFELIGSMIPSYQPVNKAAGRGVSSSVFRSPSPCFFRPSFLGSASKSSGKLSEPSLSLPVEDSQDLYAPPSPSEAGPLGGGDSQGHFSLEEDTHSQLLDADGFLNVGPRGGPGRSHKRQLLLDSLDENAMDGNMDELLGLCSGGFATPAAQPETAQQRAEDELLGLCSGGFATQPDLSADRPEEKSKDQRQEAESQGSSDTQMDELLALCSGKFTSPGGSPLRSVSSPAHHTANQASDKKEEEEELEEGDCEFRLLSDVESLSEQEDNEEQDAEEGDENDVEEEEREAVFGLGGGKRKLRLDEFVDSEAELSGSDIGSEDEDEEGGDEYEEEELQEELPSDEELQDQVNKIHMKQVLDDDKRRLRLYQERYLADGDLHSDGPGRARRFRWKNIDDGFDFGGVGADGDEEEEDEELDQAELQRRRERLEKEQWLREQSEAKGQKGEDVEDEEGIGEEDSQFMKLAKKFTAKTLQKKEVPVVPLQEKKVPNANPFQRPIQPAVKRGSLLSQPRAVLQKLASISDGNPLAPRNTRGFLFQTLSPEKESSAAEAPKKQMKKRGQINSVNPAAKRPCLENSLPRTGPLRSVFSYLEN
ncbi:claspin [Chanos chanos]|uniref:Claspin n=1 Tax=Chanos chanos TaxID=29144 RepID=A0A6J2WJ36_CHACN|nr:claspin [Chanos chanos]